MRSLGLALASLAAVLLASAASAAPVSPVELKVAVGTYYVGTYDETQLGCAAGSEGSPTFGCQGTNLVINDLQIDSWNMTFDPDPMITGNVVVTNVGVIPQQFTLTFTLSTSVLPLSQTGGSIQGGVTDNTVNFSNAVLSSPSFFYTALIDGTNVVATLNPLPVTAQFDGDSEALVPASFGLPGFTQPGPGASTSIGIRLDFSLTPGDSASFTSNFFAFPVPEPGTGLLLAFGLGALALRRRR